MTGARDARLPASVQAVLRPGESAFVCDHPRALPPAGARPADFVVLPLALAWLYPDSMVLLEALDFARVGVVLHGPIGVGRATEEDAREGVDVVARLFRVCGELGLDVTWLDVQGAPVPRDRAAVLAARGELVVRAVRRG